MVFEGSWGSKKVLPVRRAVLKRFVVVYVNVIFQAWVLSMVLLGCGFSWAWSVGFWCSPCAGTFSAASRSSVQVSLQSRTEFLTLFTETRLWNSFFLSFAACCFSLFVCLFVLLCVLSLFVCLFIVSWFIFICLFVYFAVRCFFVYLFCYMFLFICFYFAVCFSLLVSFAVCCLFVCLFIFLCVSFYLFIYFAVCCFSICLFSYFNVLFIFICLFLTCVVYLCLFILWLIFNIY